MSQVERSRGNGQLWVVLLGLGLLARALVPVGWMPVADDHGVRLAWCSGWAEPSARASIVTTHHEMSSTGGHGTKGKHGSGKSDHSAPCTFAASALTAPLPPAPATIAFAPMLSGFGYAFTLVRIGKGLAAPPPPSTGPPHFS